MLRLVHRVLPQVSWAPALLLLCAIASFSRLSYAQTSPEKQIEQYLLEAQKAEKDRDYQRSVEAYRKILKIRPRWALIHQSLGVVYHLQSRYPEAISAFEQALKLDPGLWGAHLFLGMDYYRTNQFQKAIPALEKSMKLNPALAEPEARLWLGSSFLALERFNDALGQFRRLAEIKPRDLEALYNLAQAHNRFSSALFQRITEADPESAEAHRLQGEWFEWQDNPGEAIGEYLQVVKLRPEWEGMRLAIGKLYLKKGDWEKAAREFEEELRLAPQDREALELLTRVREKLKSSESGSRTASLTQPQGAGSVGASPDLFSQGVQKFRARDFAGAKEFFSKVLQRDPKASTARLYLARCQFALGNYHEAAELLSDPDQFGGDALEALFWAGKSHQEMAALTLQKMIDLDPRYYRVHQMSGELLEDKRKYAEAVQAYQKALNQSSDLMGIRYAIGNAYWKMQNLDEALVWLKDELVRNPYHALANYRAGSIYLAKGNTDLAVSFLEKAAQANPGLLAAQQDLAKAYASQGRHQEAIERLKIVAKADPEDESVRYLLSGAYKKVGNLAAAEVELRVFTELKQKKSQQRRQDLRKRISITGGPSPEPKER